jgi:hypothetical protein
MTYSKTGHSVGPMGLTAWFYHTRCSIQLLDGSPLRKSDLGCGEPMKRIVKRVEAVTTVTLR